VVFHFKKKILFSGFYKNP